MAFTLASVMHGGHEQDSGLLHPEKLRDVHCGYRRGGVRTLPFPGILRELHRHHLMVLHRRGRLLLDVEHGGSKVFGPTAAAAK
jgi:hypothetical protein